METVFSTILVGVLVFVIGQITVKLLIDPSQELKRSLGGTSHILLLNQAKLTNAASDKDIAAEVRLKSAEIVSKSHMIPWYRFTRLLFGLPSQQAILLASRKLNTIYYGMLQESKDYENSTAFNGRKTDFPLQNMQAIGEVGRLLKIKTTYGDSQ